MLRLAISVFMLVAAIFVFAACASKPPPTPDLQATVTAMVKDIPTQTPYPTLTALSTYAPAPTYTRAAPATPYPTYTPAPAATPYPTYTPAPATTPESTPMSAPHPTAMFSPTPPAPTWGSSGYWYRDTEFETTLDVVYQDIAPGIEYDVKLATLDASPKSAFSDLSLTLGCVNDTPVGYLLPYTLVVPAGVDTYTVGIWDQTTEMFVDRLGDHPVALNDDGSGVFITNRAVLLGISTLLEQAAAGLPEGQLLTAGMWESSTDDDGLWTEFESAGSREALRYLGCY